MKKITVWDTFHGHDLDRLIDKAHEELPREFNNGDINITTQYLNNEYVVTVKATREAKFHYEIMWDQCVKDDPVPAICKINNRFLHLENAEVIKIADNDGLHINNGFNGDLDEGTGTIEGSSDNYESAYALIKVYDE